MAKNRRWTGERLEPRHLLAADVVISEFSASNDAVVTDDDGDAPDWIELFNASSQDVNLESWHLTDDADNPTKWSFPAVSIKAGDYLLVFASNKDRRVLGNPLHTNFKLGADGEYLALSETAGGLSPVVVATEFAPAYPPQSTDISYGFPQSLDGSVVLTTSKFFEQPTPGRQNPIIGAEAIRVAPVAFSHPRGFYEERFSLSFTTQSNATIRYTLDGSEPTLQNGRTYNTPISIRETTTIRVRAFQGSLEPSTPVAATYLFLADVLEQSPTGQAPQGFPTSRSINGQTLDYGMDPDIVDSTTWGPELTAALTQVPSMSLVMDIDDLLSARDGIYTNASEHGQDWERPASLELIQPDGSEGFQVGAGVRIRGGFSRSDNNPKHAFRLFFRERWGAKKLEFPLFGEEGATEFDKLDLRTAQNYSWSFRGDDRNTFLRDVFSRDLQRALGHPYTRSRYYHLYLNGQYWGLYQSQERAEANYAASYFGGDPDDYDVIKSTGSSGRYENEATDGTTDAYQRLANLFYQRGGLSNNAAYYRAQGLNEDGTLNPNYERLLDVDNLIDFALTTYFAGDRDGPVSRFVNGVNNYFAIFNRTDPDGFKFFEHDSEHSLDTGFSDLAQQPTTNGSQFRYFNPLWMHEQLIDANPDYQLRFADRVLELTAEAGPLTSAATQSMLDSRVEEINHAIIAESARWGDAQRSEPFTQQDWIAAVQGTRDFLFDREQVLVEQFRALDWFPDVEPPTLYVHDEPSLGGAISRRDEISLLAADAIQYNQVLVAERSEWKYLDDGSDQGSAWRDRNFDDGGWQSGRAQLGYGDGDEATRIESGPTNAKHITNYFRRAFQASSLSNIDGLQLRLLRDDGAIVYLNGQEILRSNLRPGDVDHQTTATGTVSEASESIFFSFQLDASLLRAGENVIAVELHQIHGQSSDASFDLELLAGKRGVSRQTIYYSTDGSDPRLPDGQVSPNAVRFSRGFSIDNTKTVLARSRINGNWSPLRRVTLEVVDPALMAVDDQIQITEGGDVDAADRQGFNVLDNDIGLQNRPVRTTLVSGPQHGTGFRLETDGQVRYQHNGSEQFSDSFTYRVTDADGNTDNATVFFAITPVSDATPIAADDTLSVREGLQTTTLSNGRRSVLDNDMGFDDGPIVVELVREPLHASAFSFHSDGTFSYQHDGSETRTDSFAYQIRDNDGQGDVAEVAIAVTAASDALPRAKPDLVLVDEGMTTTQTEDGLSSVLANDLGIVDLPVTVSLIRAPTYAEAFELFSDGTFSYTHDGGPNREDSFSYRVRDFDGEISSAIVQIEIIELDSGSPIAVADTISLNEGGGTSQLTDGTRSLISNDKNLLDGPYEIFVEVAPTAARQFSLRTDGTFFYRHDNSEIHADQFTYRIVDGDGDIDFGQVTVDVRPVSDSRPNAQDDAIDITIYGTATTLIGNNRSVLDNDRGLIDGPMVLTLISAPKHAAAFTLNPDGTFEYRHNGDGETKDRFVYRIKDNDGQESTANVDIAIVELAGDFDSNGRVDSVDVDFLTTTIRSQTFSRSLDLDGNGRLDQEDLTYLIEGILKTRAGDADLDGDVDFADFLSLSTNFGSATQRWNEGSFTVDAGVGFAEFLLLSQNFGFPEEGRT